MRIAETVLNITRERDDMTVKPFHVEITGERRDTETVMRRLEGGDWKSANTGNSLVAYPTARPVLRGGKPVRVYLSQLYSLCVARNQ